MPWIVRLGDAAQKPVRSLYRTRRRANLALGLSCLALVLSALSVALSVL